MKANLEKQLEKYILANQKLFYRLAYTYVRNADDALDIVQESIYKAFLSIHKLKNPNSIKTWFYRILVNTSLDLIRKNRKEILTDEVYLLDKSAFDSYSDLDLKKALETLPENYRTTIV